MTKKTQAAPAQALLTFEVFYNGELSQTVEFSSLRKCNNWREKNLETPFLYVIRTPACNRERCIEMSKDYFTNKHRVYPHLFERPEWDVVTEAELEMRAEQRIILEARERTGIRLSVQVSAGEYDVTIVTYSKSGFGKVDIIKGGLARAEAYSFIENYNG